MASVSRNATMSDYADFVNAVFSIQNDRYYTLWDMLTNIQRFSMRGIKGVRKGDAGKAKVNILLALSWYTSLMNQLHIKVDDIVWERFPYRCSYCGRQPCACKTEKVQARRKVESDGAARPGTMAQYQEMFGKIYPPESRSKEHAAIHLAEELGELTEAFHIYMSFRDKRSFGNVCLESADFFSCSMGVLNSLGIDWASEASALWSDNCYICHNAPCTCTFEAVTSYMS